VDDSKIVVFCIIVSLIIDISFYPRRGRFFSSNTRKSLFNGKLNIYMSFLISLSSLLRLFSPISILKLCRSLDRWLNPACLTILNGLSAAIDAFLGLGTSILC
jgi:hypothetical protein